MVQKALQDQPGMSLYAYLFVAVTVAQQTPFCSQAGLRYTFDMLHIMQYNMCLQSCTFRTCGCACVSQHAPGWLLSNVSANPGVCSDVQERYILLLVVVRLLVYIYSVV
ncbi:TPA: hypothetical protein ACH3X1_005324 [Trebouxia sp. C0004]